MRICAFELQDIVQLVVSRVARTKQLMYSASYALRLLHVKTQEVFWLHNGLTMYQVRQKYESLHPPDEWRYVPDCRLQKPPTWSLAHEKTLQPSLTYTKNPTLSYLQA